MSRDLPENWVEVPLRELLLPTSTTLPTKGRSGTFEYIDINSVDNQRQVVSNPKTVACDAAPSRARREVQFGDVIFSLVRPYLKNLAIIPEDLDGEIASTAFYVCRPGSGIYPEWLYQHLRRDSVINDLPTVGNSPPSTRDTDFEDHQVRLPPSNEQKRILAVLEPALSKIDEAQESLERVRKNLDRYRSSVLKAACEGRLVPNEAELARKEGREFEPASELLKRILIARREAWEKSQLEVYAKKDKKPPKNWKSRYREPAAPDTSELPELPEGWCWSSLGQCFEICVGSTPSRTEPAFWNGNIPWVSSGEIRFNTIQETKEHISSSGLEGSSVRVCPPGTVMVGMIGEGKTRGQTAILGIEAGHNQNCASILVSKTPIPPEYVFYWLWSQYYATRGAGSGNNQPALNKSKVETIFIPVPPLGEIRLIVDAVSKEMTVYDEMHRVLKASFTKCHILRQSFLKRAFSGKLAPQDPDDEPAAVLLERIRAQRLEQQKLTAPVRKRAVSRKKTSKK